jgi:hypothetical protein
MYGKTLSIKALIKKKITVQTLTKKTKEKDEIEKTVEERQGKAVERNSSDIDNERNKDGKRARKSEH